MLVKDIKALLIIKFAINDDAVCYDKILRRNSSIG